VLVGRRVAGRGQGVAGGLAALDGQPAVATETFVRVIADAGPGWWQRYVKTIADCDKNR
jgi:hypothetical protein